MALIDLSNIIGEILVTYLNINSNIITKEIARTISRLLNNIALGLNMILNKAVGRRKRTLHLYAVTATNLVFQSQRRDVA